LPQSLFKNILAPSKNLKLYSGFKLKIKLYEALKPDLRLLK